jgi:hypothetical protein
MLPTLTGIGYSILLVSFLIGFYQSAMRGGDLQALAVGAIKYLVVATILANWSAVFQNVNGSFNQVAEFIGNSSGAGDMFLSWMDQLKDQFGSSGFSALLPSISANLASIITAVMCFAAYLIYAVMVVVFGFFYVLYGCLLYVLGPIVLAFLPMAGVGQLARSYAFNFMIWNAWGILYATFGALITAIQFNRIDQVINQGFLIGFFQGSTDSFILGLVSVFYALALGLIPFIANRLISGDVGSSAYSLVRAGAAAIGHAASAASGFSTGLSDSIMGTSTAGAASSGSTVSASAVSGSTPPPAPGFAEGIRSGFMSAVNSEAAPPAPRGDVNGPPIALAPSPATHVGGRTHWQAMAPGFRPSGVSQSIVFQAARFAGAAASAHVNPRRS